MTRSTLRRAAACATTAAAATAALATTTGPADAAGKANPYTPGQVCGAGFGVVDSHQIKGADGTPLGTMYLLYDAGSKRNCATLMKARHLGTPTYTSVSVKKRGAKAPWVVDFGDYKYYAGPVYVKAPGQCVRYGGALTYPGGRKGSWISPFGHCGR